MKKWKSLKKIISYYTWALKMAFREKKGWMLFYLVSYSLFFLLPNVELIVNKAILGHIENQQLSISFLSVSLGLFLLISVLADVGNVVYMLFYEKIKYVISNKLFEKVIRRINTFSLDIYEKAEDNEYLERLILSSRYDLHNLISNNLTFYSEIIQTMVYIIMIFVVSPAMVIPMLLVSAIPYCYRMNEAEEDSDLDYNLQSSRRQMDYLNSIMTDGKTIKELRLYHSFGKIHQKWQRIYQSVFLKRYNHFLKWKRRKTLYSCISQILNLGILALLFALNYNNCIDFSSLFFLWQCQMGLNQAVRWFATIVPNSYGTVRKIEECRTFIEQSIADEIKEEENVSLEELLPHSFEIQLSHVYYKYEKSNFEIKDICLQIQQNKIIALLGENGSGKSTLIKLILGLYSPDYGEIKYTIDGKEQSPKKFFSCAFQDYASYHLSLRENVGLGNISNMDADERLMMHLKEVECQDVLDTADGNLDTILGKLFDLKGKELSGGQWQRLANARALYSDRLIFVFDEPTARLDPLAELEQIKNIRKIMLGKTIILVSHRIGFARTADIIYYMQDGQILEQGSHDDLINEKGQYYYLFKSQAQWYDWEDYNE